MKSTQRPTLAAVVGVCDEHEIIERCIAHLEAQGVHCIVVVDMKSLDGTRELLVEMRAAGRIALIERDNDPRRDVDYLMSGVDHARAIFAPDWILIQDADEFWISASGHLTDAIRGRNDPAILVDRFNAALSKDLLDTFASDRSVDFGTIDVWAAPLRLTRDRMDEDPSIAWITAQPVAKVIASADIIYAVAAGGHAVTGPDGANVPAKRAADLLIVHVPFLAFPRFQRKIYRARELIRDDKNYFDGATGWHWKRWVDMLEDDALHREYMTQMLSMSALSEMRIAGAVRPARGLIAGVEQFSPEGIVAKHC